MSLFEFIKWKSQVDNQPRTMRFVLQYILCGLLFIVLSGCSPEDQQQRQPPVYPDTGKIVDVNGEKFRIIYIGGVRFHFPDTYQYAWATPFDIYDPRLTGVDIHMLWPDIPPGKAPGTKRIEDEEGRSNAVILQVRGVTNNHESDNFVSIEQLLSLNYFKYFSRDDIDLGLRIFIDKNASKEIVNRGYFSYAYSLTDDANEPWRKRPIVISGGGYINFNYAKHVRVRLIMPGWTGRVNPNWKYIYLGSVEVLNRFRDNK